MLQSNISAQLIGIIGTEPTADSHISKPIHPHRPPAARTEDRYVQYLDPTFSIEERLRVGMIELEIEPSDQERIHALLAPIKALHPPTYEHCIRVGLLAQRIGNFLQLDSRALFMAGVLHDVGKASLPLELLEKTEGWTADDSKKMEAHVIRGYELVKDIFDFTADVLIHHHRYQPNAYPRKVPKLLHNYSKGTRTKFEQFGRLIALCDVYDSLHRINSRHGEKHRPSGEEIKQRMHQFNPDLTDLIDRLYKGNILTTFILGEKHAETLELDQQDTLYDESFEFTDTNRTSRNTRRAVQLACSLEPIADKQGCTTRSLDISRHLRIEYFITSAANLGDAFEEMANEINLSETAPNNLYRFAHRAQIEVKRNRRGGRVNQGIIELLTPIVAAQHLHDSDYKLSPAEILELAKDYLTKTSRADVNSLVELKRHAHALSQMDRLVEEHSDVNSVFEYYQNELLASTSVTSIAHNREFITGFPTVALMIESIKTSPYPHFRQKVEEAYLKARARHDGGIGVGFLADCSAVAIYLILSSDPKYRLVG